MSETSRENAISIILPTIFLVTFLAAKLYVWRENLLFRYCIFFNCQHHAMGCAFLSNKYYIFLACIITMLCSASSNGPLYITHDAVPIIGHGPNPAFCYRDKRMGQGKSCGNLAGGCSRVQASSTNMEAPDRIGWSP